MALPGVRKLVDYQGSGYGAEYLDRLDGLLECDRAANGEARGFAFTATAAKYLAGATAYDDILRVADLKTRQGRPGRIEEEMRATSRTQVKVTEYFHPGAGEVAVLLPRRLGAWLETRPRATGALDRLVNQGWWMRTDRLLLFLALYAVAEMRRWRRGLLRRWREMSHIYRWMRSAEGRLATDYDHAVETLKIRRLVKGYSDTHGRGPAKFERVMAGAMLVEGRDDAASLTARLIAAALAAPKGETLNGAPGTIRSFARGGPSYLIPRFDGAILFRNGRKHHGTDSLRLRHEHVRCRSCDTTIRCPLSGHHWVMPFRAAGRASRSGVPRGASFARASERRVGGRSRYGRQVAETGDRRGAEDRPPGNRAPRF